MSRCLIFGILLATPSLLQAQEYDVTITLANETPVAVPLLRCAKNSDITATDDVPWGCRTREADRTFPVTAARLTNLGTSVVWIHIGRARLPILPGKTFRHTAIRGASFDRLFVSGEGGGLVHVFAANPVQDEVEAVPPKTGKDR